MSNRKQFSSGAKWESIVGYSRAVQVNNVIEVSGTVAAEGETIIGKGDIKAQTAYIIEKIQKVLQAAGSSLDDVVRTRMFVTNIEAHWEAIGEIHGQFFGDIRPVTTMVEVSRLIHPDLWIEIEATAIIEA